MLAVQARPVPSPLARLGNLLVTVAAGPGILAHEYAHYAACRLTGVGVRARPALDPFADSAVLNHDPVEAFGADVAIAVAPFLGNSALALAAFAAFWAVDGPAGLVALWLGVCFGFTALPSETDTETLLSTVSSLPATLEPLGYVIAVPLRTVTLSVWVAGILAFWWTLTLFAGSAAVV